MKKKKFKNNTKANYQVSKKHTNKLKKNGIMIAEKWKDFKNNSKVKFYL